MMQPDGQPVGRLSTAGLLPVPSLSCAFKTVTKDAADPTAADLDGVPFNLVFFDAHAYAPQITLFRCV